MPHYGVCRFKIGWGEQKLQDLKKFVHYLRYEDNNQSGSNLVSN